MPPLDTSLEMNRVKNARARPGQPKEKSQDRPGKCQGRSALPWKGVARAEQEEYGRSKAREEKDRIRTVAGRKVAKVEADLGQT